MAEGERIERLVDVGVAALFATACAFPAFMLLPDFGQAALAVAGLVGAVAFGVAVQVLARIARRPRAPAQFDLLPLPEFPQVDALDLNLADRLDERVAESAIEDVAQAFELDDRLPAIGPDSRVVQLFGTPAQATAGELAVKIERHLAGRDAAPMAPSDASGELFDALNQLRASLR